MTIPFSQIEDLDKIAICEIDSHIMVDPVMLTILEDDIIREHPGTKGVAFIQKLNTVKGKGFVYLEITDKRVKERYLYNPAIHEHLKSKKMETGLWHKDRVPSFDEIQNQAKIYRLKNKI